jgi:hypothetical protein
MKSILRFKVASKASFYHLLISVLIASVISLLVFQIWYPHPYELLSGGRNLFFLLVGVDVVCGPLLTLLIFSPFKSRREMFFDLALISLVQIAAMVYGLHAAYQARPLFLVHEVDRFRVISMPDYSDADVVTALAKLPPSLQPHWYQRPKVSGIRPPKNNEERQDVMFESMFGGRDYSQRPDFYVPYDTNYQTTALARAKPLKSFIAKYPDSAKTAKEILNTQNISISDALFLPVIHKQEWIAVMDKSAHILGFLPGDGFEVR